MAGNYRQLNKYSASNVKAVKCSVMAPCSKVMAEYSIVKSCVVKVRQIRVL